MDLRSTQLKDTYGNLVTTGTTEGAPTSGGLQNGQGTLLTSVGIGTDSPSRDIHVLASSGFAELRLDGASGSGGSVEFYSNGSAKADTYADASGNLYFRSNTGVAAKTMILDSSGNVGIGSDDPDNKLVVADSNGAGLEIIPQTSNDRTTLLSYDRNASTYQILNLDGSDFRFNISGSEKMRIDSNGNVGIGTDNPSMPLTVKANVSRNAIQIINGGSATEEGRLYWYASDASTIRAGIGGDENALRFFTGSSVTERMRITAGGNINILNTTATDSKTIGITNSAGTTGWTFGNGVTANAHQFVIYDNTAGSERMRIDSSGNVLVGKTDTSSAVVGTTLWSGGFLNSTVEGNYVARFNRNTSDGEIIQIYKDNSAVGSIGTEGGDLFFADASYGGIKPLGDAYAIVPSTNSGADYDNAMSLGASSIRWKDLYLGGSVYLGGTTSANALDDYEEGTWTPLFAPATGAFTTMTMDVASATYTKIGRQVTVRAYLRTDNVNESGASGNLRVSGLPFASAASNDGYSVVSVGYVAAWGTAPDSGYVEGGQSYINLRKTNATAFSQVSDLTLTGATPDQNQIMLTATYFV